MITANVFFIPLHVTKTMDPGCKQYFQFCKTLWSSCAFISSQSRSLKFVLPTKRIMTRRRDSSLTSVPTEQTHIQPAPVWSVMLEEKFFFFEVNKVKHLPLFCQENYGATSRQDCTGMDQFSLWHNPFYKTLCKGFSK